MIRDGKKNHTFYINPCVLLTLLCVKIIIANQNQPIFFLEIFFSDLFKSHHIEKSGNLSLCHKPDLSK